MIDSLVVIFVEWLGIDGIAVTGRECSEVGVLDLDTSGGIDGTDGNIVLEVEVLIDFVTGLFTFFNLLFLN